MKAFIMHYGIYDGMVRTLSSVLTTSRLAFSRLVLSLTIAFMNCLPSPIKVGKPNGLHLKAKLEKKTLNFLALPSMEFPAAAFLVGNTRN
jgi:hypothetical protein